MGTGPPLGVGTGSQRSPPGLTVDVVGAQGHAEGVSAAFGDAVGELAPLEGGRGGVRGGQGQVWGGDKDGDRSYLALCGHRELVGVQDPAVEPLLELLENRRPYNKQR